MIASQAKSHCVAWTIDDLLSSRLLLERGLVEKVYLLEDCTSPVVVPGAVDYTDEGSRRGPASPPRPGLRLDRHRDVPTVAAHLASILRAP